LGNQSVNGNSSFSHFCIVKHLIKISTGAIDSGAAIGRNVITGYSNLTGSYIIFWCIINILKYFNVHFPVSLYILI